MKIAVFIIFMATLALVDGLNAEQCNGDLNRFNRFICKHVFQQNIPDTNDLDAWKWYLSDYGLCKDKNRTTQTFMSRTTFQTQRFCQHNTCEGNLCTSDSTVNHYIVSVDFTTNSCMVTRVIPYNGYVVVGCEYANQCFPAHFHSSEPNRRNWNGRPCFYKKG